MKYLAEENEELRERIRQLERLLDDTPQRRFPEKWRLTPSEARILVQLIKREWVPTRVLISASGYGNAQFSEGSMRVHLCRLRQKLKLSSINAKIEAIWAEGYKLDPATRALLREYVYNPQKGHDNAAQERLFPEDDFLEHSH
jgi:DNA-binding response OmpR family regulator